MEFRILGPLEVSSGNGALPLGGPNQRALLALLLLHPNEAVRRERLIDEIWGETPPKTADASLNVYVSRLRKLLTDGASLETRADGYALRLEPEQLDAIRFEGLLAEAREAKAAGRSRKAEQKLGAALALWRGRPLADLEYATFAQAEIARLQELRLGAIEERVEVELELGGDASVIGELEKLLAENPLRERLAGLLMLALYRSNRQAEALETYDHMRHRLAEELGLEPSASLQQLQRRILQRDPDLELRARAPSPASPRPRRTIRSRRALVLLPVCAAAVAALLWFTLPHGGQSTRVAPNSLAVLDPSGDRIVGDVPLGKAPTKVAFGSGAVWVLNERGRIVTRVNAGTRRVEDNIAAPAAIRDLVAGGRRVWLADGARLFRIDPTYNRLDERSVRACDGCGAALATRLGTVWATDGFTTLARVDGRTLTATRAPAELERGAHGVAVGAGAVWVGGDGVTRIDPSTLLPAGLPVAIGRVETIAFGADAVWAAVGQKVVKMDPTDDTIEASIPVGSNPSSIAVGGGAVWVANSSDGTITKIDPGSARVADTIEVGRSPIDVAFGAGRLWVSVQ